MLDGLALRPFSEACSASIGVSGPSPIEVWSRAANQRLPSASAKRCRYRRGEWSRGPSDQVRELAALVEKCQSALKRGSGAKLVQSAMNPE